MTASERYCPAWGPGSAVCPRDMCDCFIDQFPDDMEQAGALHPEFYRVVGRVEEEMVEVADVDEDVPRGHELRLSGPMRYPGGKDGMWHVVCSCGRYMSPPGSAIDSRKMWDAAKTHQVAKEGR